MKGALYLRRRFRAAPEGLAGDPLLDLGEGSYFRLSPIGREIWGWLASPHSEEELERRLANRLSIPTEKARETIAELFGVLRSQGLLLAEPAD